MDACLHACKPRCKHAPQVGKTGQAAQAGGEICAPLNVKLPELVKRLEAAQICQLQGPPIYHQALNRNSAKWRVHRSRLGIPPLHMAAGTCRISQENT
eukprot:366130-Chlamydomonas_euryale.AAC.13